MEIKVNVNHQTLKRNDSNQVVAESIDYLKIKFFFTDDWLGLKTALFKHSSSEEIYKVILDNNNSCYVPTEVIKQGSIEISVFSGHRVTANTITVEVIGTMFTEDGAEPEAPAQSVYEQLITIANETKEIAQSVRDDADKGLFKGDRGEQGERGYHYTPNVSADGIISWTNDGGLVNPLPVNIKGDKGDKGEAGTTDYNKLENKPDLDIYSTIDYVNEREQEIRSDFIDSDSELQQQINAHALELNRLDDVKANKTDVPDKTTFATKDDLQDVRADFMQSDSELQTQINGQASAIATLEDDVMSNMSEIADVKNSVNGKKDAEKYYTLTETAVDLEANTIYRAEELSSVEIHLPSVLTQDFICEIAFSSGAVATQFITIDDIKWTGDDIVDDAFVPIANKRYNVIMWWDGVFTNGVVRGV